MAEIKLEELESDDEDCWIPIVPQDPAPSSNEKFKSTDDSSLHTDPRSDYCSSQESTGHITDHSMERAMLSTGGKRPATRTTSNTTTVNNSSSNMMSLQRRLETRIHLKSNLVDHPIDMFWKNYIFNLARETWQLEWHISLGLLLLFSSLCFRAIRLSTFYCWYPRSILIAILMTVGTSFVCFKPEQFENQIAVLCESLFSPEKLLVWLQRLDSTGIRRLVFVILLLPTAMEMRTLSFLSDTITNAQSSRSTLCNALVACNLFCWMIYWLRFRHVQPRECLYRGLILLYGFALMVTIWRADLVRIPILAPPFLTATGTLLVTYRDDDMEWVSRILRHALRVTLRDVLATMGEKVAEDQMLQLAIMRWLAEYWATTTEPTTSSSTPSISPPTNSQSKKSSSPSKNSQSNKDSQISIESLPNNEATAGAVSHHGSTAPQSTTDAKLRRASAAATFKRHREISWEELFPMLRIATEHMSSEIQMLHLGTRNSCEGMNTSHRQNGDSSQTSTTTPEIASPAKSLNSFQVMLESLNVDERAEPAVRAYRQAVESFPPSQRTSFALSIVRRCPASLTVLWQLFFFRSNLSRTITILLPFVAIEYFRIVCWIQSCKRMKFMFEPEVYEQNRIVPASLSDANPMLILLSGDSPNVVSPPVLLLVWRNVTSSVSALEFGLTAAKCAQTTAVAVQFAGNVISLLQLGQEIQRRGLLFGLTVMAKEAVAMNTFDESIRQREATKYTHAAIYAVENAQKIARNVQILAEDDRVGSYVQPIVEIARVIIGYGWLWGTDKDLSEEKNQEINVDQDHSQLPAKTAINTSENARTPEGQDHKDEQYEGPAVHQIDALADLFDEVADACAQNLIDEAERKSLCEMLSGVLSTDTKTLDFVRVSLHDLIEKKERKDEAKLSGKREGDKRISPSTLMELVLAAYYRGLINQSEKAAFCERITNLDPDERDDPKVVGGMVRTLEAILVDGRPVGYPTQDAALESRSTRGTSRSDIAERNFRTDGAAGVDMLDKNNLTGTFGDEAVKNKKVLATVKEDLYTADSAQKCIDQSTSQTDYNHNPHVASPTSPTKLSKTKAENATRRGGNETLGSLIGIGAATLGIIGGVILSKHDGDLYSEPSERQAQTPPTVQIEETKEEDNDEWIAIPQ